LKVLFLNESGVGIGLGHVTRTNALSSFLVSQGFETAMRTYECSRQGEEPGDWLSTTQWQDTNADCVIIDSYLASVEHYRAIRAVFPRVVAIDDFNRISYPVDLVINPNVFFLELDYSNQKARTIGGIDYIILRESFRKCKERGGSGSGVLLTLGGSDFRGLLPRLAGLADRLPALTIVCPESGLFEDLRSRFPGVRVLGRLTEEQMLEEYLAAAVVISGCGQSLHELAYLGVNTTGICLAPDQVLNRAYYLSSGFLNQSVDWDDSNLEDKILGSVSRVARPIAAAFDPERNLKNYVEALRSI